MVITTYDGFMGQKKKEFNSNDFREELKKVLPGYKWTVARPESERMTATGIMSSGFNRISTIEVIRVTTRYGISYKVSIYGNGRRGPLIADAVAVSLRSSIRSLQKYCGRQASIYKSAVDYIEWSRNSPK